MFKGFWLYGTLEPATGEYFLWGFSHIDTDCYQRFLDEFVQTYPHSLNVIQVNNVRFHKSKDLIVPDNVILLFQTPYCLALKPIEHLWEYLKTAPQ